MTIVQREEAIRRQAGIVAGKATALANAKDKVKEAAADLRHAEETLKACQLDYEKALDVWDGITLELVEDDDARPARKKRA